MTEMGNQQQVYVDDIENILIDIFKQQPMEEQPRFVVQFGGNDLLSLAQAVVEQKSMRGKKLDEFPMTMLAFDAIDVVDFVSQAEEIKKQSVSAGDGLLLCYIDASDQNTAEKISEYFEQCHTLIQQHGMIVVTDNHVSNNADEVMLAAAAAGLFPVPKHQHRYPSDEDKTQCTLNLLEHRDYVIRHPTLDDVADLVKCEKATWKSHLRVSEDEIKRRIEEYNKETLVVIQDGEVIAVSYSHRIHSVEQLKSAKFVDIAKLSYSSGAVVQLLALNVLPEHWSEGVGDQLLEFVLYRNALRQDVSVVVASTRCSDFLQHSAESMQAYIEVADERGLPVDPIPRFHVQHGAEIVGLIPDYRPEDKENEGYGVLIRYDVKQREFIETELHKPSVKSEAVTVLRNRDDVKKDH